MGKGLYTNKELIGTLLNDLNLLIKDISSGQYIQFCVRVASMSQRLTNLYNTIDNDLNNAKKTIEILKDELRAAGHDVKDMTPTEFIEEFNKGGADNGGS